MATTRQMKTSTSTTKRLRAEGKELADAYAQKFAVRQQRSSIEQTARIRAEEAEARAGRVTSPEVASIAATYMQHEDANVRTLAASVLAQTTGE